MDTDRVSAETSLTLFAHVCGKPEAELDLAEGALLVAEVEYPDVDVGRYLGMLDGLGRSGRERLAREQLTDPRERLERLLELVYGELGFHGDRTSYYDPRNSFLNDVLDRRTGIPISLAVLFVEVARRAGVEAKGLSFPGHFLVRSSVPGGALVIDPFEGRLLSVNELRGLYVRATGKDDDPPSRLLVPATKRQILLRMLSNLRSIYAGKPDSDRLRSVLERMQVLAPDAELGRELEQLGGRRAWPVGNRSVN